LKNACGLQKQRRCVEGLRIGNISGETRHSHFFSRTELILLTFILGMCVREFPNIFYFIKSGIKIVQCTIFKTIVPKEEFDSGLESARARGHMLVL
jgi:hypothetical protein